MVDSIFNDDRLYAAKEGNQQNGNVFVKFTSISNQPWIELLTRFVWIHSDVIIMTLNGSYVLYYLAYVWQQTIKMPAAEK